MAHHSIPHQTEAFPSFLAQRNPWRWKAADWCRGYLSGDPSGEYNEPPKIVAIFKLSHYCYGDGHHNLFGAKIGDTCFASEDGHPICFQAKLAANSTRSLVPVFFANHVPGDHLFEMVRSDAAFKQRHHLWSWEAPSNDPSPFPGLLHLIGRGSVCNLHLLLLVGGWGRYKIYHIIVYIYIIICNLSTM